MNEQKIKLEGLQIGMFVSQTDVAWSQLPFMMEGVLINNVDEIEVFTQHCDFIVIDVERGKSASPMYWLKDSISFKTPKLIEDKGKNNFKLIDKVKYEESSLLGDEVESAKDIYKTINTDISNTFNELRLSKSINLERIQDSINTTVNSVIRNPTAFKLVMQLKEDSDYTFNHALRSSVWCAQFGRHIGYSNEKINALSLGGVLLDVGKSQIDKQLLSKKDVLSSDELQVFYAHVNTGLVLLSQSGSVSHDVMQMVATHHERADKSGYPQKLGNDEIPIYGKIGGIIDSYDAMTSKRPFRKNAYSPHQAISHLYEQRNNLFSQNLVEEFIQTVGVYPVDSLVELNTDEVGIITAINAKSRLRPIVMIVLNKNKKMSADYYQIDLLEQTNFGIKRALNHSAYGIKMNEVFLEQMCEFLC